MSMASSQTRVFASVTAKAAAHLTSQYCTCLLLQENPKKTKPSSAQRLPWLFRLLAQQAPVTFSPHLFMVSCAIQALNMVHSNSMSSASPRMCEKFLPEVGPDRQMFPVHPYKSFVLTRFVRQSPPPSVQAYHQLVICWDLFCLLLSKIHYTAACLIMQPQSWSLTSTMYTRTTWWSNIVFV